MIPTCRKAIVPLLRASTLMVSMLSGYYHRAFAGTCTGAAGTYLCSDPANSTMDTEQTIDIASPLTVTTAAGFGIDTSTNGGDALDFRAVGGLTITDTNLSTITGSYSGILANNSSSEVLSITINGTVTGGVHGIFARNYGSDLNISTADVTGGTHGIVAFNSGSDVDISTADVTGGLHGIVALNTGSGSLSITSSGTIEGAALYGIKANNAGTDLNISAKNVYGGVAAVYADNSGSGALSISTSGTVMGGIMGIYAINYGTDLSISAANVTGGYDGIAAINITGDSLTVTTSGTVTGIGGAGIYAINLGGPTTITVGSSSLVQGDGAGIYSYSGYGQAITITVDGMVRNLSGSPSDDAILAAGGPITVTLNSGSITTGVVALGNYNDTINLAGTLNGSVEMEAGDDTFFLADGGTLTGTADGGAGTDTLAFDNVGTVDGSRYLNFENLEIFGGNSTLVGTWDLSGGTATIHRGSLSVNGSLFTSLLIVGKNGLLGGNGNIFSDVKAYGIVSPGNSIGTLTVNGSVDFMPGSIFNVELAANERSDLLKVGGAVSIDHGKITASLERALYPDGTRWNILAADDGIHGRFSSISSNFTSYTIALEPVYTGGSLSLVVDRTPYSSFGASPNQAAVGSALDQILPSAQGSMTDLLLAMDFAMDPAKLSATLNGLNPEIYTSFAPSGLSIAGTFNRMATLRQQEFYWTPVTVDDDQKQLWSVWGRAIGSRLDQDEENWISGYTVDTGGTVFGMDRTFGAMVRAGLMLGYSSSDLSWDKLKESGSITGKHIKLYSSARFEDFSLDGGLGYTNLDNSVARLIDTPAFSSRAVGDFDSNVVDATLSGTYNYSFGNLLLVPTASINYLYLDQDGFTEQGVDDFGFHIQSKVTDTLSGLLGLRLSGLFDGGAGWHFHPTAGLDLVHWFKNDAMELNANFVDYQVNNFRVTGADPVDNAMLVSLGMSADYNKSLTLFLNYESSFADGTTTQMLSGGIVWCF